MNLFVIGNIHGVRIFNCNCNINNCRRQSECPGDFFSNAVNLEIIIIFYLITSTFCRLLNGLLFSFVWSSRNCTAVIFKIVLL